MLIISNIQTYFEIATEALAQSERFSAEGRPPKPDGSPNNILIYDPQRRSFKHALTAIVFAAAYLEALLHIEGYNRLGAEEYERIDKRNYRFKLEALGVTDPSVLAAADRFRLTRKDLLHEKAVKEALEGANEMRTAQTEARTAIEFINSVRNILRPPK